MNNLSNAAQKNQNGRYNLRLFVANGEPNSNKAKENLARICETHLKGRCDVEIIDVLVDFEAALKNNILITPTLLLVDPPPRITIFGNLGDTGKVMSALRLLYKGEV